MFALVNEFMIEGNYLLLILSVVFNIYLCYYIATHNNHNINRGKEEREGKGEREGGEEMRTVIKILQPILLAPWNVGVRNLPINHARRNRINEIHDQFN